MKLVLFFTRGVSLKTWLDKGLFDREKQIYEQHLEAGNLKKVYFLTYGKNDDDLARNLHSKGSLHLDISVLRMPGIFNNPIGRLLYPLLMPFVHRCVIRSADLLKTNQMLAVTPAIIAKILFKKPLIVRTGYSLTKLESTLKRIPKAKLFLYRTIERLAYYFSDIAVVTAEHDKKYITEKYNIQPDTCKVIPNFIDTKKFSPVNSSNNDDPNRIIYVGSLTPLKNLENLIIASAKLKIPLDIYGNGILKETLRKHAEKINAEVNFKGSVSNDLMPQVLKKYNFFVLPSVYEAMPKAILEAMACGLLCIGTNVEGITEIISDNLDGFIAKGTDPDHLIEAIQRAQNSDHKQIKNAAVQKINSKFTLESIIEKEHRLFIELTQGLN